MSITNENKDTYTFSKLKDIKNYKEWVQEMETVF